MGDPRKPTSDRDGAWRAESPINNAASARQPSEDHDRIRRPRRVGEEDESRQGLSARPPRP